MCLTLANNVRAERARARLSRRELSQRTGLTEDLLYRIEAGKADPRVSDLIAIAKALGVSHESLMPREPMAA